MGNRVKHIKRALKATKSKGGEENKKTASENKKQKDRERDDYWMKEKIKRRNLQRRDKPLSRSRESVQILLLGGQIKE